RELTEIGDRVTVLRDGRNVGTFTLSDVSTGDLVRLMANRDVRDHFPRRRGAIGEELLRIDHLCGPSGGPVVNDVSLVVRRGEIAEADRWVGELRSKTRHAGERVVRLSGGTQQKVVLARSLAADAKLFVMDEPTRGVDVGAKVEIYELMNRLTDAGAGILMI